VKIPHKVNHGWVPPSSPLHMDETSDRYGREIEAALRKADKAHRKALKALEKAERNLLDAAGAETVREARATVERIRAEVERRFLELRELEIEMQRGPSTGANRSGKGSVRNPLPKGTKL
jgi:acyl-CoA reductase-like NAD-dependent aldehyde dehydrogenase